MRRITPFLDPIIKCIKFWIGWSHAVNQQEDSSWFQDASNLPYKLCYIWKMVRCDTAGYTIKAFRFKWKIFSICDLKDCIRHSLGTQIFLRFFQHTRCQIGNCDLGDMWRNCQSCMSTTGGNIQRMLFWTPFSQFDKPPQIIACPM